MKIGSRNWEFKKSGSNCSIWLRSETNPKWLFDFNLSNIGRFEKLRVQEFGFSCLLALNSLVAQNNIFHFFNHVQGWHWEEIGLTSWQYIRSSIARLNFEENLQTNRQPFIRCKIVFRGLIALTLRTGFHVKSKCLNVGRVPAGFCPAACAGAADLLGRVSQTRTVLKTKEKQQIS